jgi:tetratricopeptide (TPR) repeat protein
MDKWVVYILLAVCLSSCGQASGNKQVKQGTDSLQNDTVVSHPVDSLAYAYLKSGNVKSGSGDKLGAIAEYDKAIEIDSNYAVAQTAAFLGTRLASNYTKVNDYVYATAYGDKGLEFNHYIQIDGLHNPYVEYTYPEYYVVLTARIEGTKTTLHANTLHEFRAPGSFAVGDSLLAEQLETVITALLHADEFISEADGIALPKIPLDVRHFRTPVQNLCVQEKCLQGEFLGDRPQVVQHSRDLLAELQGAFARHIPGYTFKCRLQRKGTDRWMCSYTAVPTDKPKGLDAHGERVLKTQLNLTPDQIVSVRKLLLKGY